MRGTFSPSCLPFPLRNPGFGVRDDRNVRRYRRASRMLSERLWGGSFHSHIMTIVGRRATLARTVKLDGELRCPAMPTIHTANSQTAATLALIDTSCMLQAYGPSLNGAVPDCTQGPRARRVVHKRTDGRPQKVQGSLYAERRPNHGEPPMLFIVGVVIVLVAVVTIPRMLAPTGVNPADLGPMSEQWLSEHRGEPSH